MPIPWNPPTLRDALDATAGNPLQRCHCGRVVTVDMLVNVRALPASVRGAASHACDACRERWYRQGLIAREDAVRLMGAPADVVSATQAWALAHDPIRRSRPTIPLPTP